MDVISRLHIINGDSAGELIQRSRVGGEVLPWRDVLHEGPVPAGLDLEQTSSVRATFLAGVGEGSPAELLEQFVARDARLARFREYDETVLWFEHDLYDQLQLLQLLHWFSARGPGDARLSLICIGEHAEVPEFHGLGNLNPRQIGELEASRRAITRAEFELGHRCWQAFVAADPTELDALRATDLSALPFLGAALKRMLEQYPAAGDGLSRTERQILESVAGGAQELAPGPPRLRLMIRAAVAACTMFPPPLSAGKPAAYRMPCATS